MTRSPLWAFAGREGPDVGTWPLRGVWRAWRERPNARSAMPANDRGRQGRSGKLNKPIDKLK